MTKKNIKIAILDEENNILRSSNVTLKWDVIREHE